MATHSPYDLAFHETAHRCMHSEYIAFQRELEVVLGSVPLKGLESYVDIYKCGKFVRFRDALSGCPRFVSQPRGCVAHIEGCHGGQESWRCPELRLTCRWTLGQFEEKIAREYVRLGPGCNIDERTMML